MANKKHQKHDVVLQAPKWEESPFERMFNYFMSKLTEKEKTELEVYDRMEEVDLSKKDKVRG